MARAFYTNGGNAALRRDAAGFTTADGAFPTNARRISFAATGHAARPIAVGVCGSKTGRRPTAGGGRRRDFERNAGAAIEGHAQRAANPGAGGGGRSQITQTARSKIARGLRWIVEVGGSTETGPGDVKIRAADFRDHASVAGIGKERFDGGSSGKSAQR